MTNTTLTQEQQEKVVEFLIAQMGYLTAADKTNGFDLVLANGFVVVKGYEESLEDGYCWTWDDINGVE